MRLVEADTVDQTGTTRTVGLIHRSIAGGPGYLRTTMALRPDRGKRREAAWWVAHMAIVRAEIEHAGGLDVAVDGVIRGEWEPIEIPTDGRLVPFELVRRARTGRRWRDYWGATPLRERYTTIAPPVSSSSRSPIWSASASEIRRPLPTSSSASGRYTSEHASR